MITRNKNTLKQFAFWILVGIVTTTVFLGISIYFTDDVGSIYFPALFSALGIALLVFGLFSTTVIKNYVSRGQTRRTFFKESSILTAAVSLYALIVINVCGWLLNLVPGLAGQILTTDYTENFIMLNLVTFISVIVFYYLGMVIIFSFRKSVLLGIILSIILGLVVNLTGFFSGSTDYLLAKLIFFTATGIIFGIINSRVVKTTVVKV